MPTWSELLKRLGELKGQSDAFDILRREALASLAEHTGRNVILYASAHLQKPVVPAGLISIGNEDIEGFMEVIHGLKGTTLDLILHSPGGRAESAEALVNYLRSKFKHIRVFVPHEAMSAATMMACAADSIVMGRQSYLGPIDPQFQLSTPLNPQSVQMIPAGAILDQFERAKKECQTRENVVAWIPMLQQYGPALLEQCKNAQKLSEELVSNWLFKWMLHDSPSRKELAKKLPLLWRIIRLIGLMAGLLPGLILKSWE